MLLLWTLACGPDDPPGSTTTLAADDTAIPTSTDCDAPGSVALDAATVDTWHWEGEANPVLEVGFAVTQPPCDTFLVETDAAWLTTRTLGDASTGTLVLDVDAASLPSGTHAATVSVRDGASGTPATLTVTVRALHEATGARRRHALVIGVDGLDGDELARLNTPTLDLLRRHALWTNTATTQLTADTLSGPGWTSVLTGVEAADHGVTANADYADRNPDFLTFLARLAAAGVPSAVAFQWDDLFEIVEPDSYEEAVSGDMTVVTEGMERLLLGGEEQLYFVHLDDVDHAGHASGFSADSAEWVAAVTDVERSIDRFLAALAARPAIAEEQWLIVLTADHGGSGTTHGDRTPDNQTVPLIVAGPAVPPGVIGTGSHLDVHPTLLRHFGLDPSAWALDGVSRLAPREDRCDDGIDGDGDGDVDCDDDECAEDLACKVCAPVDLGSSANADAWSGGLSTTDYEGSCGGSEGAEQLFAWTAPTAGAWIFSAEGSGTDTTVYVLDGGCDGAEIACAADIPGLGGGRGGVSTPLAAGQAVTVVVDSAEAEGTGAELAVLSPPLTCPDGTLESGETSVAGDLPAPTAGILDGCATAFGPVLYAWTAPSAGTWTFDTLGSDGDTVLYVLDGCGGSTLACNDDASDLQSIVSVDLAAGQEVVVAVGSFAGNTDSYTLNVSSP